MENVSIQEPKLEQENKEKDINYKRVYIRLSVVLVGIIIIFCLNNFYKGDFNSLKPNQCYNDLGHNWTSSVNEYFRKNIAARNAMLIFTGLLVDITMLTTFYFWIFKWTDWVIAYAIALFYGIRGIFVLNTFQLTFPEGYNFYYPGFPSLAVCYLATNDFFYSGHIGFPLLFALEYSRKGENYLVIVNIFISVLEGSMMLIARGHYTIDLIFGVIFAHYLYKISLIIEPLCEKYLCCVCKDCTTEKEEIVNKEVN
jgi:hypothetical protein